MAFRIWRPRVPPFVYEPTRIPGDVVLARSGLDDLFFARTKERAFGGVPVPVASVEEVVTPKVLAGQPSLRYPFCDTCEAHNARRSQPVVIAGGQRAVWPVAEVRLALDGSEVTMPCFIAPDGPTLLGAVAPESLFLAVDSVAKRLIPVEGFVG